MIRYVAGSPASNQVRLQGQRLCIGNQAQVLYFERYSVIHARRVGGLSGLLGVFGEVLQKSLQVREKPGSVRTVDQTMVVS